MAKHPTYALPLLLPLCGLACVDSTSSVAPVAAAPTDAAVAIAAPAATLAAPTSHRVVCRVTGVPAPGKTVSGRPWMVFLQANGAKVPLPYQTTQTLQTGQSAGLGVRNDGWDMGDVRLEVEVDGRVVNRVQGNGVPQLAVGYRIPPPGATAACADATFSFADSKQGSCSDHGGVEYFYLPDGSVDPTEEERPSDWRTPASPAVVPSAPVTNAPPAVPEPAPTMDDRTNEAAKAFGLNTR